MKKNNKIIIHFSLLFLLLFFGHIVSIVLFKDLTVFYHDNLDSIVVYNQVIGKIISNKYQDSSIFLGGNLDYFYLRHFFKPFILIYSVLDTKYAYFINDLIVKLIAYCSFFIFAKKFSKNFFIVSLLSALYASSLYYKTLGYGLAFLPYLIYLVSFKKKIKIKHYLIIILFGINTDLVADFFIIPTVICLAYIVKNDLTYNELKKKIYILIIFFSCAAITSANLIYIQFFEGPTHRIDFANDSLSFIESFKNALLYFFKISNEFNWVFIKKFPYLILTLVSIVFLFLIKSKIAKKILFLIIFLHVISFILNLTIPFVSGFKLSWILIYEKNLYVFLVFFLLLGQINYLKKYLIFLCVIILIIFQTNSSAVPFIKKYIQKSHNYRNIYTFDGYYMEQDYKKIKDIVKNERTISIGYDPMIAIKNDIYTLDGYHAVYPLDYKKKFFKIIEKELDKNKHYEKYYINWGSRVYCFVSDKNNIEIDFVEAKKLNAVYVISEYKINNLLLELITSDFIYNIYLYKIK